jgi:hypothetical protein
VISVLRLQRLAALYSVPVDQLLPRTTGPSLAIPDDLHGTTPEPVETRPVTIDLARLEGLDAPESEIITHYIGMIQLQRGDYNGRVITIRNEDVRALARVFERDETDMRRRIEDLGIRL